MGARDKFWELKDSTWYSLGTRGEHVIQLGNWRGARDVVWELEGSTWYSLGTGGVHTVRDPARKQEGARDAGNSLVQIIEIL